MAEPGFDRAGLLAALARHGRVVRVVLAEVQGSSPRGVGAAMLVWAEGQEGTIGGGALEHMAVTRARDMLADGMARRLDRVPLGPGIGQCCGGAVVLLSELFVAGAALPEDVVARAVEDRPMPLAVKRLLDRARARGERPVAQLVQGWMVEPVAQPMRHVWVWGAGHVGRALVGVLAPLPDLAITWVDTAPDRFPDTPPDGVIVVPAADPARLVSHAPVTAEHLVLTWSHALDLDLCHRIMARGHAGLGVIGSDTKAARFRARLRDLGHSNAEISRLRCPIGDKGLGKHPQAIALGVALALLQERKSITSHGERAV
ncbi:xanthine dehydrogenase accessory protein XdhC [Gemmobacter denitrificans]|uniref:Xanthine dehydrogenase accessory protein XdhC n=1 Tax=Gemmobacter denitrificans TaxID=3123040 RepID=A0ABU8BUX2_9RHOB